MLAVLTEPAFPLSKRSVCIVYVRNLATHTPSSDYHALQVRDVDASSWDWSDRLWRFTASRLSSWTTWHSFILLSHTPSIRCRCSACQYESIHWFGCGWTIHPSCEWTQFSRTLQALVPSCIYPQEVVWGRFDPCFAIPSCRCRFHRSLRESSGAFVGTGTS